MGIAGAIKGAASLADPIINLMNNPYGNLLDAEGEKS
jgi:hypothetical protein